MNPLYQPIYAQLWSLIPWLILQNENVTVKENYRGIRKRFSKKDELGKRLRATENYVLSFFSGVARPKFTEKAKTRLDKMSKFLI